MLNYSSRLELDVSFFKFIFDGGRIIEDEMVRQLEMKDSNTINMVLKEVWRFEVDIKRDYRGNIREYFREYFMELRVFR